MKKPSLKRTLLTAGAVWCCLTLVLLGLGWLSSRRDIAVFSAVFAAVVAADLLADALAESLRRRLSPEEEAPELPPSGDEPENEPPKDEP